jgi:DNA-binding winged helix-turn-helix (wHTH) protein
MAEQSGNGEREARGFALYVGLSQSQAQELGIALPEVVKHLRQKVEEVAPGAATHATIALAPTGIEGDDLEIVRLALHDPGKLPQRPRSIPPGGDSGVDIDISRKQLRIHGKVAPLTFLEFELLQFLVLREGQTVEREAMIEHVWSAPDEEGPNQRTIDVHIRRLRGKIEPYEDIIRTVRGAGYRFDRHADVTIIYGQAPSPDAVI